MKYVLAVVAAASICAADLQARKMLASVSELSRELE